MALKRSLFILFLSVTVLLLTACEFSGNWLPPTPSPTAPAAPSPSPRPLPDLVITEIGIGYRDPTGCPAPGETMGLRIWIENQGQAPADPFIVEVNDELHPVQDILMPGESISLWFSGFRDENHVRIDSTSLIEESNEQNNQMTRRLPIPTLPVACLPEPTPELIIQGPVHILEGHDGRVTSVVFSPDGRLVATGSVDNTMRLWRASEGELLRTMRGHPFPVISLAFTPNGAMMASGSTDGLIRLWRVSDGSLINTLDGHAGWVQSLDFSNNGVELASGSSDYTVRLWRTADGRPVSTIDEGMSSIENLAFSGDSSLLAWVESNGNVRVWRVRDENWLN